MELKPWPNEGAAPTQELSDLNSEVRHLIDDFRQHKSNVRDRFEKFEIRAEALRTEVHMMSRSIDSLTHTLRICGGVAGPVLLVILTAVVTRLFVP